MALLGLLHISNLDQSIHLFDFKIILLNKPSQAQINKFELKSEYIGLQKLNIAFKMYIMHNAI